MNHPTNHSNESSRVPAAVVEQFARHLYEDGWENPDGLPWREAVAKRLPEVASARDKARSDLEAVLPAIHAEIRERVADAIADAFGFGPGQGARLLQKIDHPDVSIDVDLSDACRLIEGACGFGTNGERFKAALDQALGEQHGD